MPTKITEGKADKELLDWARKHRSNIELRNKMLVGSFMLVIAIVGSFALNYYGLRGLTTFIQGFFFELGVLLAIFFIELASVKVTGFKNDAMAAAMVLAMAAAGIAAAATATVLAVAAAGMTAIGAAAVAALVAVALVAAAEGWH